MKKDFEDLVFDEGAQNLLVSTKLFLFLKILWFRFVVRIFLKNSTSIGSFLSSNVPSPNTLNKLNPQEKREPVLVNAKEWKLEASIWITFCNCNNTGDCLSIFDLSPTYP